MDKATAQHCKVQQFETDRRQELGVRKFSVKIPWSHNSSQSSKIKIILSRSTAQQPKVQQFESTGFQDPQTEAETSGSYYYSSDEKSRGVVASRVSGGEGRIVRGGKEEGVGER
jgi:hypothetical protein